MKQPDISTPDGLFGASARYRAPIFQRLYVWGKNEFESLVEDIDTADPEYGQFLGAIVLKDLGRTKGPTSPANYLIIDGQQRLTTLYLVLLAIAHIAYSNGQKQTAQFIWQNYLVESKSPQFSGWPKLIPTLQDRHTLWNLLERYAPNIEWDFSADPEEKKPKPNRALSAQWNRILSHYQGELVDEGDKLLKDELDRVLQSVQGNLRVICITLEEHDDANGIFSRLNAKGVPLELADLVRNEVFSKFASDGGTKAESFYAKHWHPFEKAFPRDSLNQFFPVYSYIIFKGRVTKSAAFPMLQSKWKEERPAAILADLQKYCPHYWALVEFKKNPQLPRELNGQVERFSRMPRTTVTWPFLIEALRAVCDGKLNPKEALTSLRIVESFLVRRALAGIEPTGLHAVFKSLWERTKGSPSEVLEKVVTRTIQCPKDGELRKILLTEPVDSRVVLKYVLEEYERAFVAANRFDLVPTIALTIEHVLPQNLSKSWRETFATSDHRKLKGLIGNLVGLSETQNKSLQDQEWDKKRRRFKGSNFKSTQNIAEEPQWTGDVIRARTRTLASWVITTWPSMSSFEEDN